jgi:hypothetical protein
VANFILLGEADFNIDLEGKEYSWLLGKTGEAKEISTIEELFFSSILTVEFLIR